MKNKFLIFALLAQFLLIAAMFINAYLPLFLGTEIKLRARGFDPRDLLAGNFVWLDYGARLDENLSKELQLEFMKSGFRLNEKDIYISLIDSDKDGIYELGAQSLTKPAGLFLKTKVRLVWGEFELGALGIEQYFAPKDKALELEKELQRGGSALVRLKIYEGRAKIVDLEPLKHSVSRH